MTQFIFLVVGVELSRLTSQGLDRGGHTFYLYPHEVARRHGAATHDVVPLGACMFKVYIMLPVGGANDAT